MLPFVVIDESKIAPLHPYGVCCAIAFFVWDWALLKMAERRGFDRADFRVLTVFLFVFGWGFAWLVDALFYPPVDAIAAANGPSITGLSSTGAILGATIGSFVWARLVHARKEDGRFKITRRERPHAFLPVSEVILATWPVAWAIGRLGCALVHDHVGTSAIPGTLGSLFAVAIPRSADEGVDHVFGPVHVFTGGSDLRYDLGLVEFLLLSVIAIGFALTWRRKLAMGTYTMISTLIYGPFRFGLDFLRATEGATGETRHGGLTFGQYWALAVVAVGVVLAARRVRAREARSFVAAAVVLLGLTTSTRADAAERWIDRAMTQRRLVFAGDVGLGIAHARSGVTPFPSVTGLGMNLEGAIGVTDHVELGLRTGIRFDNSGRGTQADAVARTLWTETYGTGFDTLANPEFRVRWVAYSGSVVEVGLDGRIELPFEENTRLGTMFGVPLALHVTDFLRIDTGAYVPVVFYSPNTQNGLTIPGYFWFQPTEKLWLGPMTAMRFIGFGGHHPGHLLLGFGLGYQVASAVDLKTMLLFPAIDDDPSDRFGIGFGVQFRIGE